MRLQVLLARSAPVAVVFRHRGWGSVQMLRWATDRDTFQEGAWFLGHVDPSRSDLSPDGTELIYSFEALNPSGTGPLRTCTAIARPPDFTPVAIWREAGIRGGFVPGGAGSRHHEATGGSAHRVAWGLRIRTGRSSRSAIGSSRLDGGGWTLVHSTTTKRADWNTPREVWQSERPCPGGGSTLVRRVRFLDFNSAGGCTVETFAVRMADGTPVALDASWADWDFAGRLILIRGGGLYSGHLTRNELLVQRIVDLTDDGPPRARLRQECPRDLTASSVTA